MVSSFRFAICHQAGAGAVVLIGHFLIAEIDNSLRSSLYSQSLGRAARAVGSLIARLDLNSALRDSTLCPTQYAVHNAIQARPESSTIVKTYPFGEPRG